MNAPTNAEGVGRTSLREQDPEIYELLREEKSRQRNVIELIASENFTSKAVMQCLGSALTNKYSEGYPGRRYYAGNQFIDKIEVLCQQRALQAFGLDPEKWGVNVQPYSGSPANFAAYTALLRPHDRIMGMDLPSGGHLTHGFYTAKKKVSATSIFFESLPYKVDETGGWMDYDRLLELARHFRPQLIIAGVSAYPRDLDYKRFREVADDVGAILLSDMAHVSGLVAGKAADSPFEYCDIVTTTTHKSLRGPRMGMIFFNKRSGIPDVERRINEAVFPSLQGGPHNHQIAAAACQLKEVCSAEWRLYAEQVVKNCKALCECLKSKGYKLVTGGSDNHMLVWDLRELGLTGSKVQEALEEANITLNKNTVPGDVSAISPSGVRIGAAAMTTRGLKEKDFKTIGEFLHRSVTIIQQIAATHGKKIAEFREGLVGNREIEELGKEVQQWVSAFPLPGHDDI